MSRARTVPRPFARLDNRGTPWLSIALATMVGVLVFLPFTGWSRLIDFLAAATAFMYAFAPVSLAALRRSDPDRYRPFKVPAAGVFAPVAFVFANLIIYWQAGRRYGVLPPVSVSAASCSLPSTWSRPRPTESP